ncbi:MAG TPA: hypothetical protein VI365_12130 [Trebonia sp.]
MPPQADDCDGHEGRDRAGGDHERGARHPGCSPLCRVMEQDAEDRGQGHGRRGVPAGERELTEMRPVDEVLEHRVVEKRGHGDGGHREHHAIAPPGDQATGGYGDTDRDERDGRSRQREPGQDALVTADGRDHRSVDDGIEPVRLCLPPNQEAERGDDDHARG